MSLATIISGYIAEFFLYVLAYGITFSNAATEVGLGFIIFAFFLKYLFRGRHVWDTHPVTPVKEKKTVLMAIVICFVIFLSILFISYLRSPYPKESSRVFFRILRFFFLYFAAWDFFHGNEKRMGRFFWGLMIIAGFTFLNGIFQGIFGFDILRHKTISADDTLRRLCGSFVHPNDFAAYLITVLPLTFLFLSKSLTRVKRIILIILCVLGLYCLLRTSSRSGWIGFAVGMLIFFFYYNKKLVLLVPVAGLALVLLVPHGLERTANLFKNEHNTVWERKQLWKGTWEMVKVHPVLGFGLNTYSRVFPQYKPAEYPDLRYTHNSYLQMLSEIGFVGLLSFLSIIVAVLSAVLSRFKQKIKNEPQGLILLGLFAGYIGFLVQATFDTNFFSLVLTTHFWVWTAYMVALSQVLRQKTRKA